MPNIRLTLLVGTYANEAMYFGAGGGIENVTFQHTSYGFQSQHGTFTASGVTLDGLPGFNGWSMSFLNDAVATVVKEAVGVCASVIAGALPAGERGAARRARPAVVPCESSQVGWPVQSHIAWQQARPSLRRVVSPRTG